MEKCKLSLEFAARPGEIFKGLKFSLEKNAFDNFERCFFNFEVFAMKILTN